MIFYIFSTIYQPTVILHFSYNRLTSDKKVLVHPENATPKVYSTPHHPPNQLYFYLIPETQGLLARAWSAGEAAYRLANFVL